MSLTSGQTVNNRYRIVKLLGQGGFGAVYRAWDVNLQHACALKENLNVSDNAKRQFEREAKLLAGLSHPALPRVTDHFVIPDQGQYLVMDYIEGDDLSKKLEQANGPLPVTQVLAWIIQVCDALAYLHSHKPSIIHRDIKPANIKITPQGQAVLVDFGIAKVYDPEVSTTVGARAITPGYSPPEQYGAGSTNVRSDIYALGATTYHLLTRQSPAESVQRMMGVGMPAPRALNPAIPPAVENAILTALELLPENRFAAATDFAAALQGRQVSAAGPATFTHAKMPAGQAAPAVAPTARTTAEQPIPASAPQARPRPVPGAGEPPRQGPSKRAAAPIWLLGLGGLAGLMILCVIFFFAVIKPKPTPIVHLDEATRTRQPGTSITQPTDLSAVTPSVTLPLDAAVSPGPDDLPPACTKIGQSWTSPKDNAIMLCVPAGEFSMGSDISDPDAQANEMPQHTVALDAYWIDQTEVTNAMYARCVSAGTCIAPANTGSATRRTYYGDPSFDNYPIIYISQKDAQAYCRWRWARLPSEAEWEKAARGSDGSLYPWGDTFDGRFLNFCDSNCTRRDPNPEYNDGYADTAPVSAYPSGASPYGVLDMAGNVWEMVMDWYGQTYYTSSPRQNPTGPYMGDAYVMRGGAWDSRQNIVRAAVRYTIQPGAILDYVGFRCAATP